jgi:hypothetical protein
MGRMGTSLARFLAVQHEAAREGDHLKVNIPNRGPDRLAVTLDLVFFVLGILCFALAVLLNMF